MQDEKSAQSNPCDHGINAANGLALPQALRPCVSERLDHHPNMTDSVHNDDRYLMVTLPSCWPTRTMET